MTGSQKKQLRQRFRGHLCPVKTFRGDPTRPAYTLYSLWNYPTYLAAMNELHELLDEWPCNRSRTLALLAVRQAFFDNGATHWEVQMVADEDQTNVHALMLHERQSKQRFDPGQAARHLALAEAALVESQRRKQGPPTGSGPRRLPFARPPKALVFIPAKPRPNNRPAARPRYTVGLLLRDPLAYYALVNELDALLEHWPYQLNRILHLLAVHEGLARSGRVSDDSRMLDPGNAAHQAVRTQYLRRVTERAANPQHAARHEQRLHEARSLLKYREPYRQ